MGLLLQKQSAQLALRGRPENGRSFLATAPVHAPSPLCACPQAVSCLELFAVHFQPLRYRFISVPPSNPPPTHTEMLTQSNAPLRAGELPSPRPHSMPCFLSRHLSQCLFKHSTHSVMSCLD